MTYAFASLIVFVTAPWHQTSVSDASHRANRVTLYNTNNAFNAMHLSLERITRTSKTVTGDRTFSQIPYGEKK